MNTPWFEASKEGLAKLVEGRPKVFLLHELLSNSYDTGCRSVSIDLQKVQNRPLATIKVVDDHPEGFATLSHAWTLFAESERKSDAEAIGRFNMGEKLVLAVCESATITTTTGQVVFGKEGRTTSSRVKRQSGSCFEATIRMTAAEYDEVVEDMKKVLYRETVEVTFNDQVMQSRPRTAYFTGTLQTVIGDDGGSLRRTRRQTRVDVYEVKEGEVGTLYEMGIPVVQIGDSHHLNVLQKVPLNMERDNVPASFLRDLRGYALSAMVDKLSSQEASEPWVTDALSAKTVEKEAIRTAVIKRFGEKSAVYDPSDREANGTLTSRGFNVVHGGSLPKAAWDNVRSAGALLPSGQIAPTPKPYSTDPDARPAKILDPKDWTPAMTRMARLVMDLHRKVIGTECTVAMVMESKFSAAYGGGRFDFFVKGLGGSKWFDNVRAPEAIGLIVHEFAHHYASDHNDEKYHKACTRLAGLVADVVYREPEMFSFLYR